MPSSVSRFSSKQTLFDGESRIPLSAQLPKSKDLKFNKVEGKNLRES
jgi:hypothetical protein